NLTNRALRERLYKASVGRGLGGPYDNTPVIAQLVKLRAERASLLGYPSHAPYPLPAEPPGTPTPRTPPPRRRAGGPPRGGERHARPGGPRRARARARGGRRHAEADRRGG